MQLLDAIQLTAPAPESVRGVTAQTVGVPGIRQYFYWIVTHYPIGATIGGPFFVPNAPSVLSATDYVLVTGKSSFGAVSYDVLRTDTGQFPSAPGNFALATGLTQPQWRDQAAGGAAPGFYDPTGLPYGAPVSCIVHLNNRDFPTPTLELPCAIKVSLIIFPDGSEQSTAGGGSQTPWTSDIDAANFNLNDAGFIGIGSDATPPWARLRIVDNEPTSASQIDMLNTAGSCGIRLVNDQFSGGSIIATGSNYAITEQRNSFVIGGSQDLILITGGNVIVWTAGSERMRITAAGQMVVPGGIDAGAESFFNIVNIGTAIYTTLPTTDPGPGSHQLWADPADGYRVKWAV